MEDETPTTGAGRPVVRARTGPPKTIGLYRQRLHDVLQQRADHRLTLIVAPAGSGKTAALAQLGEQASGPAGSTGLTGSRLAWYQASADDRESSRFLAHIAAAFAELLPPGHSWACVTDAVAALDEALDTPATLVVDDAHALAGTPAEAALEQLVAQAPPGLSIVVAGRRAPSFNLSRLRVSGGLLEIGPAELSFRSWEVERLFRDVYGHALGPDDLAELQELTYGWAAGLQLFHLVGRTKAPAERRRLLRTFPSSALVHDYLAANVFDGLRPDLQTALLHTSTLGVLSGERCARFGGLVGADIAAYVEAELRGDHGDLGALGPLGAFLDPLDDGSYRPQPLWQSFLRHRLSRELGSVVAAWHLAAGRVHEEAGDLVEALEAYSRAATPAAAEAIDAFVARWGRQLAAEPGRWSARWPLDLPAPLVAARPWLQLAAARSHVRSGRIDAAHAAYLAAEESFARGAAPDAAGASVCELERRELCLWVGPGVDSGLDRAVDPSAASRGRQQPSGSRQPESESEPAPWPQLLQAALSGEPQDVLRQARVRPEPEVQLVAGLAALLGGQLDECRSILGDVVESAASSPVVLVAARLANALVSSILGDAGAAREVRDAAAAAERVGVPWLGVAARVLLLATAQAGGPSDAVRWARARDAAGDRWGALALLLAGGLGALVGAGAPASSTRSFPSVPSLPSKPPAERSPASDWRSDAQGAAALLEEAADRSRALGAAVVEGWALLGLAVAHTRGDHPDAADVVALAEKTALTLGLPGLQAVACVVAAVVAVRERSAPDDAADYRAMASSLASSCCADRGPSIVARLARAIDTEPGGDGAGTQAAGSVAASPVLIGRRSEVTELWSRWEVATTGTSQFVRVEGETGIGKTALLAEFARRVGSSGGQVRWCRGVDDAPRYWPWRNLVRALVEETPRAELAGAVGPIAEELLDWGSGSAAAPFASGVDDAVRLAEGVAGILTWATSRRPLLIVFDDAHRADLDSLRVLRSLGLSLQANRVMIVVGSRDEGWSMASAALLGERALSSVVRLRGLAGDELRELVEWQLEVALAPEILDVIEAVTGGNPSFVEEVVRGLRPHCVPGTGTMGAGRLPSLAVEGLVDLLPVPNGLRVLINRRLQELEPSGRSAVQTGAMLEPRVDVDLLSVCLDVPVEQVRIYLERAAGLRLVEPVGPGVWGFPNDGVRQVLAEGVADEVAAQVHLRAADYLEERAVGSMVVSAIRIAQHLLVAAAAGLVGPDRLVRWITAAANEAAGLGRSADSIDLCERALEVVGLGPGARGEVLYQLAQARRDSEGERSARTTFVTAANAGRATRNSYLLARAALGYGRTISEPTVVDDTLVALLEEAERSLPPGDGALRAQVEARLAGVPRGGAAGMEAQAALSTAACDRAYRVGDPAAVAGALDTWHSTLWGADLLPARLDAAAEMARYAEEAGDIELLFAARRHRHHDLLELGDVAAADVELATAARLVRDRARPSYQWRVGVMRAGRALLDGRFGEAERLAADALTAARGDDSPVPQEYFAVQMLVRSRELGRLQAFDAGLRRLDERRPEMAVWRAARAYVQSQTGRAPEARTELDRFLAEDLARVTRDVHWLTTMAFLGDVAATLRQEPAVEQLYRVLMPWSGSVVVCGIGAAVWGSVSRILGQLAGVLDRYEDATVHFDDALARETRLGSGPLLARTKLAYGSMLIAASVDDRDRDRERQGRALIGDAVETAEGYGMAGIARDGAALLAETGVDAARSRRIRRPVPRTTADPASPVSRGGPGDPAGPPSRTGSSLEIEVIDVGDADVGRREAGAIARGQLQRRLGATPPMSIVAVSSPTTVLRCLGSYRFEVRGRLIDLGAMKPRVRAVLWLLSIHAGRAVHAETLIDGLWPGADLAAGRRNLQVAISSLRQALEPGTKRGLWALLAREGDSYRLVIGDDVDCDLRSFAQSIGEARNHRAAGRDEAAVVAFERALSLYTGDLIPEAGPADWIVVARDGLRQQAAGTALALAELQLGRGETAAAIVACERGLTIDRYRDELWRVLFNACEQDGNHVAGARARQQYEAVLIELGIRS